MEHRPVLWQECLEALNVRSGGVYIDCTLGGGGHGIKILEESSPDGRLIGIDRDPEAIEGARRRLAPFGSRATLINGNLRHLESLMEEARIDGVDGVLMDLGISTLQLKAPDRGFGFQVDAPLDMRMNRREPRITAWDIVNREEGERLGKILLTYGEEKRWRAIVKAIVGAREKQPIQTTRELAMIIEKALPGARRYKIHPATRAFQALRIAVNDELNALREGLKAAVKLLRIGGRLGVISFHSLEDRIVKQYFQQMARGCVCPPKLALCACGQSPLLKIVSRGAIRPGPEEVRANPASRSARLRITEKLGGE